METDRSRRWLLSGSFCARSKCFALLITIGMTMTTNAPAQTRPETELRPFSYELHGAIIEDPYHWLEGSHAPEVPGEDNELDERVRQWTEEQNSYTRGILDGLPGRETLEAEVSQLLSRDTYGTPRMAGDWLFYTLRSGGQAQSVLYVQRGEAGEPRVLLDVNTLDETGLLALDWYRPSPDGRLVELGTYQAGDELTTASVLVPPTSIPIRTILLLCLSLRLDD